MGASLDELVESLLSDIALAGVKGIGVDELSRAIHAFYDARRPPESQDPSNLEHDWFSLAPSDSTYDVDDRLVSTIWGWLTNDPDIAVREFDPPGPTDPSSGLSTPVNTLRLVANQERVWQAVAGHSIDLKRLPQKEFDCLSVIAAHGSKGCLQPILTRITGQDKRSVPKRTDLLCEKGYITKENIIACGSKTTLLTLKRFANSSQPRSPENAHAYPENLETNDTRQTIYYDEWYDKMMEMLLENDRVVALEDLRIGLSIQQTPHQIKAFRRCWLRLVVNGCLRKISAEVDGLGGYMNSLQLMRDPTESDKLAFKAAKERKQLKDHGLVHADESKLNDEDTALAAEVADEGSEWIPRTVSQWTPDLPMNNLVYNIVDDAGVAGISSMDLTARSTGALWRRQMDDILFRLTEEWSSSQPLYCQHLGIVRDSGLTGKYMHYTYRTIQNFEKAVQAGLTSWDTIRDKDKTHGSKKKAAKGGNKELDEWGFAAANPREFAKNGRASLLECQQNVAEEVLASETMSFPPAKWERPALKKPRKPHGVNGDSRSISQSKPTRKSQATDIDNSPDVEAVPFDKEDHPITDPPGEQAWQRPKFQRSRKMAVDLEMKKYKVHTKAQAKRLALAEARRNGERLEKSRIAEIEADILERTKSGVYIRPPGSKELWLESSATRGRPKRNCVVVFKLPVLCSLEWFVEQKRQLPQASTPGVAEPVPAGQTQTEDEDSTSELPSGQSQTPDQTPDQTPERTAVDASEENLAAPTSEAPLAADPNLRRSSRKRKEPLSSSFKGALSATEITANPRDTYSKRRKVNAPALHNTDQLSNDQLISDHFIPTGQSHTTQLPLDVQNANELLSSQSNTVDCDGSMAASGNASNSNDLLLQAHNASSMEDSAHSKSRDELGRKERLTAKRSNFSHVDRENHTKRTTNSPFPDVANAPSTLRDARNVSISSTFRDDTVACGLDDEHQDSNANTSRSGLKNQSTQRQSSLSEAGHSSGATNSSSLGADDATVAWNASQESPKNSGRRKGIVRIRREDIITSLVHDAGGAYPGNREIWYPFLTSWKKRHQNPPPDRHTLVNTILDLCSEGRLRKHSFEFRDDAGQERSLNILAEPELDVNSPEIRQMQIMMIDAFPYPYVPKESEIAADLVSQTFNVQRINGQTKASSAQRPRDLLITRSGARNARFEAVEGITVKRTAAGIEEAEIEARELGFGNAKEMFDAHKLSVAKRRQQEKADSPRKRRKQSSSGASVLRGDDTEEENDLTGSADKSTALISGFQSLATTPSQPYYSTNGTFATSGVATSSTQVDRRGQNDGTPKQPESIPQSLDDIFSRLSTIKKRGRRRNSTGPDDGFFDAVKKIEKWEMLALENGILTLPESHWAFVNLGLYKRHIYELTPAIDTDAIPGEVSIWASGIQRVNQRRQTMIDPQLGLVGSSQAVTNVNTQQITSTMANSNAGDLSYHGKEISKSGPIKIPRLSTKSILSTKVTPKSSTLSSLGRPSASALFRSLHKPGDGQESGASSVVEIPTQSASSTAPVRPARIGDVDSQASGSQGNKSPYKLYQSRKRTAAAALSETTRSAKRQLRDKPRDATSPQGDPLNGIKETDRLSQALSLARLLFDWKEESDLPWRFVGQAMGPDYDIEGVQKLENLSQAIQAWEPALTRTARNLQEPFLKAYELGELGVVDFARPETTDAALLMRWVGEQINESNIRDKARKTATYCETLPSARQELEDHFDLQRPAHVAEYDAETYFDHIREYARLQMGLNFPHGQVIPDDGAQDRLAEQKSADHNLILAKSLARAITTTPTKHYHLDKAMAKIQEIGPKDVEQATNELLQTKTFKQIKVDRQLPGRNYVISKTVHMQFKRWHCITPEDELFIQIGKARSHICDHFERHDRLPCSETLTEAENLVLMNMVAQGHLKLLPRPLEREDSLDVLPPKLSAWGWRPDRAQSNRGHNLRFPLEYIKTPKFTPSDGLKRGICVPLSPPPFPGEQHLRYPYWVDLNGHPITDIWNRVVRTIVNLIVFRPGSSAEAMETALKCKLWTWEINLVLGWMEEVGLAEHCGVGVVVEGLWMGGWRATEWWYCAFMDGVMNGHKRTGR